MLIFGAYIEGLVEEIAEGKGEERRGEGGGEGLRRG